MRKVRSLPSVTATSLLLIVAACSRPSVKPEVFIAEGMPVALAASPEREGDWTTCNLHVTLGPEADLAAMLLITVGPDNQIKSEAGDIVEATVSKGDEHASHAWPDAADVHRFIVLVERVETSSGVWVLDSQQSRAELLQAIIEHGRDALPQAKFIRRD
jgi:hypothetical protein